ncbi:MAG: methyltransferase domain-containing protein [Chlamydiota bacterium]|jgi:hypothetical protein
MATNIQGKVKDQIHKFLHKCGYDVRKYYDAFQDTGREYEDPKGVLPHFTLKKVPPTPWSGNNTQFIVNNGTSIHEEVIYYSHLTLLKMCKHYDFHSVVDIGSHEGRCTRVFRHLGKEVTTVEIAPGDKYEADYREDYLKCNFDRQFDAIWCSQIYEHQRNPGIFLDKVFDDLKEGGILALTVPLQLDHYVLFGHLNITSPLMLIYHLVCAGFDCREIALRCYNGSIGVILKKKYNGITRHLPNGVLPLLPTTPKQVVELLGDEIFPGMIESFPQELVGEVHTNLLKSRIVSLNWDNPI